MNSQKHHYINVFLTGQVENPVNHVNDGNSSSDIKQTSDVAVQTEVEMTDVSMYSTEELKDQKLLQRNMFLERVLWSDKSCKFYTGIK